MWKSLKRLFGGGGEDPPSPPGPPEEDPPAPGWDAIDAAFSALYGAKEAAHWGHGGVMAMNDLRTPPQFPLDGISAWDGGTHWHYVGYGLSDLYSEAPPPDSDGWSGFGLELGLRLAKEPGDEGPPSWVCTLLQQLARGQYSGSGYAPGHTISTGPVGEDTEICGFLLAEDPDLGVVETPVGKVCFVLLVGATQAELEASKGGHGLEVLEGMRETGWVTRF